MNKSTSQPQLTSVELNELDTKDGWLYQQPENQQIQQFKVILKNMPYIQNKKWSHKNRHGVQSMSNLECIVENSQEESNFVTSMDDLEKNLEFIDSVDSLDDEERLNKDEERVDFVKKEFIQTDLFFEPIKMEKRSNFKMPTNETSSIKLYNKETISTISTLSASLNNSSDLKSSNFYKPTAKRSNYESNLKNFNNQTNKSNYYKQIKTDDNFFFGRPNLDQTNEE